MPEEQVNNLIDRHAKENEKSFDRLNELIKINGEHMSHFRKEITEIKDVVDKALTMLQKQDEVSDLHRADIKKHMDRVEPMISAYEKDTAFTRELGIKGKKWGVRLGLVASAIASYYVIKEFISSLLK